MNNVMRLVLVIAVGAAGLVGCGSDEEDALPGEPGTPNEQAAVSATQTAITALQTAIKPSSGGQSAGQQSANQLSGAAQATQNVVQPGEGTAPQSLTVPLGLAFGLSPLADGEGVDGASGVCTCTESSCTFQACNMGGLTMDGTYSWGGGVIKCDGLTYTFNGAAAAGGAVAMTIDLACDLTVTETSLDGMFHSKGHTSSSYGGYTVDSDWDTKIEFAAVTFPAGGGAPTSGSEHIEGTTTTTMNGESKTYAARFDVTFPTN